MTVGGGASAVTPRQAAALPSPARHAVGPLDLARTPLPEPLRPAARLSVCDITEFFGDTSGGVRTYLDRKAAFVAARPELRQVIVVSGARDSVDDANGVRIYRLRGPRVPMQPPYRFMLALRQPRRIIEHERPDLVEIGSPGLVPWIVHFATRRTRTPLVCFWHSHYPGQVAGGIPLPTLGRGAGRLAWRYARAIDRLVTVTVVASEFVAHELQAAGIERVARIPLGVDLERFHPHNREAGMATRRRLGLPGDAPLAVYVGRFAPEKRIDVLLRAWPEIHRRTGTHLALIGAGSSQQRLAAIASASLTPHAIHWLPFVSARQTLAELIAAADLCIAPGPVETFGLAALEALASGTPVLAVNAGAAAELVRRSGGGALYENGDASDLARGAGALLGESGAARYARTRAARTFAEREHDWDRSLDRLFALHADVAAGRWDR